MDVLEQQLMIEQSKVKSPGLAAVMGFFFPWLAAFYTGHMVAGIVFVLVDILFFALSIIGIGFFFLFGYGIVGAVMGYNWATKYNRDRLSTMIRQQRSTSIA